MVVGCCAKTLTFHQGEIVSALLVFTACFNHGSGTPISMIPIYTLQPKFEVLASAFLSPWFRTFESEDYVDFGLFDEWKEEGRRRFLLSDDPAAARFHVLYEDWRSLNRSEEGRAHIKAAVDLSLRSEKQLVIFCGGDQNERIDWPENAAVFRFALRKSEKAKNELSTPIFHRDHLRDFSGEGVFSAKDKSQLPLIAFCGYAPPFKTPFDLQKLKDWAKLMGVACGRIDASGGRAAHAVRAIALMRLMRSKKTLKPNFIIREKFGFNNKWGILQPGGSRQSAQQQRREFANNILESDYSLCVRGLANCSIRLYETMSLGRIPLVLDTDCVYPCDSLIDWESVGPFADRGDLWNVPELINRFHQNIDDEGFVELQERNRGIWEKYLCPTGFFSHIPQLIASLPK